MKHIKLYEDFVNEATTSWKKMMQGVRSSETGPWSIVAIENKKVVGQKIDIKIQDMIPAHYEAMRKEFPRAKIHIEDGTGMVVWNESLEEGTYNSKREIAIYDGAEGLTYIEKRGKGYYGYNDEFDFEATDKADLEKKLKSWKYKLISGSIDENTTELDEAVKIQPGTGAFYKYTQDHKLIEKIFKEAFKGQEDKLYRANFFNTGAPCIKFELQNQSSWMLMYYPGQTYLEDHGLGSISLYPYGPQEDRYKIFKVGVKGNRRFGDTKMTPAEIKEAATEFKNWVNSK
jgi:hypothetical protein